MNMPRKCKRLLWISVLVLVAVMQFAGPAKLLSQNGVVRLALVNVPDELLRPLLPDFQKQTGLSADIAYTGNDPFTVAREGRADLVISHYGHEGVEPFVTEGLGLWPHPVFANQMALLGPPSDPAHVRRIADASEAFRRIAASKSRFIRNNSGGAVYLEQILWASSGVHEKGDWYLDLKSQGQQAARDAASKRGYVLWGLAPFLRLKRQGPIDLEPLVFQDPMFQRIMVAILVNPKKVQGVNVEAAKAFQAFLIAPATQARVRAFRYPDFGQQAWWPAGRHNSAHE